MIEKSSDAENFSPLSLWREVTKALNLCEKIFLSAFFHYYRSYTLLSHSTKLAMPKRISQRQAEKNSFHFVNSFSYVKSKSKPTQKNKLNASENHEFFFSYTCERLTDLSTEDFLPFQLSERYYSDSSGWWWCEDREEKEWMNERQGSQLHKA